MPRTGTHNTKKGGNVKHVAVASAAVALALGVFPGANFVQDKPGEPK
jgi:hypothetical protein